MDEAVFISFFHERRPRPPPRLRPWRGEEGGGLGLDFGWRCGARKVALPLLHRTWLLYWYA